MIRIIADSSCNLHTDPENEFYAIPLTMQIGNRQFTDDGSIHIPELISAIEAATEKTSSACPPIGAWMDAMEGAKEVLMITITSGLSGAYNAALAARDMMLQADPEMNIRIIDSRSTGPEMGLLLEKAFTLRAQGLGLDAIYVEVFRYSEKTRLIGTLQSLHNLAINGRVSKVVAAAVGVLGIRILITASPEGQLAPIGKVKGDRRAISEAVKTLADAGYQGGRLHIDHIEASELAVKYADAIRAQFPGAHITVGACTGLCTYYAEKDGILIGFETV